MRVLLLAAASITILSGAAIAADDGDAFRYLTREQAFALVSRPNPEGAPVSSMLSQHDDFAEMVVQRTRTGLVELHEAHTDYIIVMEGSGTVTIGGAPQNRRAHPSGAKGEWLADTTTGGTDYALAPGAMLTIPKGTPHWIQLPTGGQLRYVTIKRRG